MSAKDDPRTAVTFGKMFDVVRSAEMAVSGQIACTHPREVLGRRIMAFVRAADKEKAWPSDGDFSDQNMRPRAIAVAELLVQQGMRVRIYRR